MGAVGSAVAARLLSTRNPDDQFGFAAGSNERAALLRASGVTLGGAGLAVACSAAIAADEIGAELPRLANGALYELILLCTRAQETEPALAVSQALLARDGAIVCLQNGLPEEKVAARVGAARTLGAVIGWSATSVARGSVRLTGRGSFLLGTSDSAGERQLENARQLLSRAFPTRVTRNLAGARWSKLALNCAISTLGAVSGLSFGELCLRADARGLVLACIAEVVQVAQAKRVKLSRISGLDPRWLADSGSSRAMARIARPWRHALLRLVSRQRPTQRSGMLERLLAGRSSGQIEDLNGAVVAQARALNLAVPLNERLLARVRAIEQGDERIGVHAFAELS